MLVQSKAIGSDASWWANVAEICTLGTEATSAEMQECAEVYATLYTEVTVQAARQTHALEVIQVCGVAFLSYISAQLLCQAELDSVRATAHFLDTPSHRFAVSELTEVLSDVAPLRSRIAALYAVSHHRSISSYAATVFS